LAESVLLLPPQLELVSGSQGTAACHEP